MTTKAYKPIISLMLAVPDAPAAVAWYKQALGATELWSLGSVIGLEVEVHLSSWPNQPGTVGKAPK